MTTRTLTALAKGSAALAVVLPLGAAAVIPGLSSASPACSNDHPSQAVCQATDVAMTDVADLLQPANNPSAPQLPGAPQTPGTPGAPAVPKPPSMPQPGK
jgi:hypothetical protein